MKTEYVSDWETSAQEKFESDLVEELSKVADADPNAPRHCYPDVDMAERLRGMPFMGAQPKKVVPYPLENYQIIKLRPHGAGLRNRRDLQAKEIRRRLDNPEAIMLATKGRLYSAKSIWGVFWLYIKCKLFPKWARKKFDLQTE